MAFVDPTPFKLPPPFDVITWPEGIGIRSCEMKLSYNDVASITVEFIALQVGIADSRVATTKKEEKQPTRTGNRFGEIEYEEDEDC